MRKYPYQECDLMAQSMAKLTLVSEWKEALGKLLIPRPVPAP